MLWKVSKGCQGQFVWEHQNKEGKSDGIAVVTAKVRAIAEQHLPRTSREVEFAVTIKCHMVMMMMMMMTMSMGMVLN